MTPLPHFEEEETNEPDSIQLFTLDEEEANEPEGTKESSAQKKHRARTTALEESEQDERPARRSQAAKRPPRNRTGASWKKPALAGVVVGVAFVAFLIVAGFMITSSFLS